MREHPPKIKSILVLAGPTASGKSALAVSLAEKTGAVIINADSMQVYKGIPILTAQPDASQRSRAEHRLYGCIPTHVRHSVMDWLDACLAILRQETRPCLVVGGTGLYIKALIDGLSIVPDIPDDIRRTVQESRNALGAEGFYTHVAEKDPIAAQNLSKTDTYRQMRALEVILATGRSIMEWRANKTRHENFQFKTILLLPNRTGLYERINQRFDAMLRAGVLAEVEALGHGEMPAFKAVGAAELRAYLDGMMTIEQATDIAKQNSRRLAKRQFTWFRHQLVPDLILTDFLNDVDHLVEYF